MAYLPGWMRCRPGGGKSVGRLVEMLRREGVDIPDDWRFRRVYAGRSQRLAGAWSWSLENHAGRPIIGSCDAVRDCLRFGVDIDVGWHTKEIEAHARYHREREG